MDNVHDIYKYAVNSMTYMILKEAQGLFEDCGYGEELGEWMENIQPESDSEVLAYVAECAEQELREWSDKARHELIPRLAAWIGEGYEEVMFFHIVKTVILKIEEEDSDDSVTNGGQEQ